MTIKKRVRVKNLGPLSSFVERVKRLNVEALAPKLKQSLVRLIAADYDNKSTGGVGIGGITWAPKTYGNKLRGIGEGYSRPSGTLRDSLNARGSGTSITMTFLDNQADFFDERFTLLDEDAPEIQSNIESVVQDAVDAL
jgi:hypothetical protein